MWSVCKAEIYNRVQTAAKSDHGIYLLDRMRGILVVKVEKFEFPDPVPRYQNPDSRNLLESN